MFGYLKTNQKAAIVLTFLVKNNSKCINHIFCLFRGVLEESCHFRMGKTLTVHDLALPLGHNSEISSYLTSV